MTRRMAVLSAVLLLWVGCTDTRTTPVVGLLGDNTNLSLNSSNTTLKVGQTQQLSIIHTHNGLTYTGNAVWQSSAPGVATVDTTGLITAVSPGTASITATNASGEQDDGSVTITVIPNLLTVTGLTWSCSIGFCEPTGGVISGAPPNSPVSEYLVLNGQPFNVFGGTSLCGMVADATGSVPVCTAIAGIPSGTTAYFCPNNFITLGGGGALAFLINLIDMPGFAASQDCAGPFVAE